MPALNWALFAAVLTLMFGFGSSTKLATAYGVAVTGTFLITTTLFLVLARTLWNWAAWKLLLAAVVFGTAEITYFAANLTKIVHGGWLPLLIAATVFMIMMTWQRGREIMMRRTEMEGTLGEFVDSLPAQHVTQVAGTAIYPHLAESTAPLALRLNVEHNHALHKHVIVVSARTADVPHIPWAERITVEHLGDPREASCTLRWTSVSKIAPTSPKHSGAPASKTLTVMPTLITRPTSYREYRCAAPANGA